MKPISGNLGEGILPESSDSTAEFMGYEKRTALQCQARGCDGCVVCDRENYTLEDLERYRRLEMNDNDVIEAKFKHNKG